MMKMLVLLAVLTTATAQAGKCRAGTRYSAGQKGCVVCGRGYISTKNGARTCRACPAGKTTTTGSARWAHDNVSCRLLCRAAAAAACRGRRCMDVLLQTAIASLAL